MSHRDRLSYSKEHAADIIAEIWLYILAGVGIGSLIHNWIPERIIAAVLGERNIFSVLLATVAGVPMHADIFGTLPIAEALVGKGVGIGTVLAFMMAVTALSLPSMILLKQSSEDGAASHLRRHSRLRHRNHRLCLQRIRILASVN